MINLIAVEENIRTSSLKKLKKGVKSGSFMYSPTRKTVQYHDIIISYPLPLVFLFVRALQPHHPLPQFIVPSLSDLHLHARSSTALSHFPQSAYFSRSLRSYQPQQHLSLLPFLLSPYLQTYICIRYCHVSVTALEGFLQKQINKSQVCGSE